MTKELLKEGLFLLKENGGEIPCGDLNHVLDKLERYIAEIELFNPAYKLVGTNDRKELIVRHILDSLSGLGVINRLASLRAAPSRAETDIAIADAGSGAGLPGIPLAISMPRCHFTLIERMGRRAGFLNSTLAALGIQNVTIEEKEIEKAAPNRFDVITFRAFKPLDRRTLKSLFRLLTQNGVLAAYKGRRDAIEKEFALLETSFKTPPSGERESAIDTATSAIAEWEIIRVSTPFLEEERHIVVIPRDRAAGRQP
ncbi:MAG: 16S rRNA (guanine(527)-N(7))-methyltransferase RsmG [Treponema sp.]|jgi:16S rRNA (guanine527-N7)-methyltransferase|nr:16S rRNA (guanine(527)-N(7))-methyltransferase RsmG [Treponema sp.]